MKRALPLFVVACLFCTSLNAQVKLAPTVISSGGGYYEGESISISWTLGEVAVTTLSAGDIILTQGFQQPFDIDVGFENEQASFGISAYPNPVGDQLRVRFDIQDPGDYLVEIQDVTGRLVRQMEYSSVNPGDILLLNTSTYTTGVYFLRVSTRDRKQVQVTSLRKL